MPSDRREAPSLNGAVGEGTEACDGSNDNFRSGIAEWGVH
jgi:hypothetical protein